MRFSSYTHPIHHPPTFQYIMMKYVEILISNLEIHNIWLLCNYWWKQSAYNNILIAWGCETQTQSNVDMILNVRHEIYKIWIYKLVSIMQPPIYVHCIWHQAHVKKSGFSILLNLKMTICKVLPVTKFKLPYCNLISMNIGYNLGALTK